MYSLAAAIFSSKLYHEINIKMGSLLYVSNEKISF